MNDSPLLELHLHITNGSTHRFIQNDPGKVHQVLQQIDCKVFAHPNLLIAGEDRVMAYRGAALVGISVIMQNVPKELFHLGFAGLLEHFVTQEVTEAEFRTRQKDLSPIVKGQPFVSLQELEMTTGHHLFSKVEIAQAVSGLEERALLNHVFSRPCFPVRRIECGITIWNSAQMVSQSIAPRPEAPSTAWSLEPVS